MATDNPSFRKPPVVEVVCGVQFTGAERLRTPHFGVFWEQIRAEYPDLEDRPPLEKIRFEEPASQQIRLPLMPPFRRVFFVQQPPIFLMQLQQDRLLHNWRKVNDGEEYPRFDKAFAKFMAAWEKLNQFAGTVGLDELQPEAFELTYINHISKEDAKFPGDIWRFLNFYETAPSGNTTKDISHVAMQFAWPLPDALGTLSLDLKHGSRSSDEKEILMIELTVQGKAGPAVDMSEWFSVAHRAIVRTFNDLTTSEAHALWVKY